MIKKMKTQGAAGTAFDIFNHVFMIILCVTILLPFWNLLTISFDKFGNITSQNLYIWPRDFTLENYITILSSDLMWSGYFNTIMRTLLGVSLSLICTSMGAFALSKKNFPHRTFWTFFIIFTMFFGGGLIPTFLWIRQIGLYNNRLVYILPSLVGAYNLVLVRNFIQQMPAELEESARIDGASDFRVYRSIILPLSKPILATIALWIAVGHWNAWFDALVYMRDSNKLVVQVILQRLIQRGITQEFLTSEQAAQEYNVRPEMIKAACVYVTTLPILCAYPFLQKYFVKGIFVGSLKG